MCVILYNNNKNETRHLTYAVSVLFVFDLFYSFIFPFNTINPSLSIRKIVFYVDTIDCILPFVLLKNVRVPLNLIYLSRYFTSNICIYHWQKYNLHQFIYQIWQINLLWAVFSFRSVCIAWHFERQFVKMCGEQQVLQISNFYWSPTRHLQIARTCGTRYADHL